MMSCLVSGVSLVPKAVPLPVWQPEMCRRGQRHAGRLRMLQSLRAATLRGLQQVAAVRSRKGTGVQLRRDARRCQGHLSG